MRNMVYIQNSGQKCPFFIAPEPTTWLAKMEIPK